MNENPLTNASRPMGRLLLVPAPLDFGCAEITPLSQSIPHGTLVAAANIKDWICENAKSTRAYLKRIAELLPLSTPLQEQAIVELPREIHKKGDHAGTFEVSHLLRPASEGRDIGLISEAGMPAIADPGSSVVRAAHTLGISVVPLVGPVSLLLALAASGLNGQNFAFVGYVPQATGPRAQRLRDLEALALKTGQTQLFIEAPYRNTALLNAILQTLSPNTRLATATGLTLGDACCRSSSIKQWKQQNWQLDNGTPTVFAIGP